MFMLIYVTVNIKTVIL